MRELRTVRLLGVIVHILDTKEPLEVSELPIPGDSDDRIFDYFRQRIRTSLKDSHARTANFQRLSEEPATTCQAIIRGGDLTEGSQQLARRLFGIMKQDGRISAGDLAVCSFDAEDEGGRRDFLSIMKIDPTAALRQKRDKDPQGRLFVTYDVVQQMLPTQGEQLQKAAFIQSSEPRRDYDLLLLDRQVRPPEGPRVAQFFSQSFLTAVEALTPEESTRLLVRETKVLRKILKTELPPEQDERFAAAVDGALSGVTLDLDAWVANLELPESARKRVGAKLGPKRFPERRVDIVQEVVRSERERNQVFQGDHGLRVEIPPEFPPGQFRDERMREPGRFGGREFHVVTFETERWQEQR